MADYIKRKSVVEYLKKLKAQEKSSRGKMFFNGLIDSINAIPSDKVREDVHGDWEDIFQDGPCCWSGRCSVCGVRNDIPPLILAHFCPNCGAQMDGE